MLGTVNEPDHLVVLCCASSSGRYSSVGVINSPSMMMVPMWLARVMVSLLFWPMAGSTICPALPFLITANCFAVSFITLGGLGEFNGVGLGLGGDGLINCQQSSVGASWFHLVVHQFAGREQHTVEPNRRRSGDPSWRKFSFHRQNPRQ